MSILRRFGYVRCEKVLPLVFDDSLSYMELLYKILGKLNDVIDVVNIHEERLGNIEEYLQHVEEMITARDEDINDLQDRMTNAEGDITNITQIVNEHNDDLSDLDRRVTKNTNDIARLDSRVSVLEGYAFEGITPIDEDDLEQRLDEFEQYIVNNYINVLQEQIDAIMGGGYTPTYGSVDFGLGTLLKADPTEEDPDRMIVASQDFQVSAAYVQALNMVYGCFYISQSEGAEVVAMPGDTFVLCWKNSTDLPPIASDFPGVKVRWDANRTHQPDLFKMGIDYDNTFRKRVDCFFGKRDQYPEILGSGYKWYAPVYLDNIQTGSPVRNWAIIQIPFCYLSLRSLSVWDYELEDHIFNGNISQIVDTGVAPFSASNLGRNWEFYMSVSFDDNSWTNDSWNAIGRSMLLCCNASATSDHGNMYWTGGNNDTDLTHSQMKVEDPGFGIGGGSFGSMTAIQECIRGTNFRKRSGSTVRNLKSLNDNDCVENVIHCTYDNDAHTFTTEITYRYSDTTEETVSDTFTLMGGSPLEPMEFDDSDRTIILGGCLTNGDSANAYMRFPGDEGNPITVNYFRFRYIAT